GGAGLPWQERWGSAKPWERVMTVRVDFVDCSCVRRAVRSGANEKNGKEQEPWHNKSSAHQATLGRGSRAGYALSWEKTSSPVGLGGWKSRRWTTRSYTSRWRPASSGTGSAPITTTSC